MAARAQVVWMPGGVRSEIQLASAETAGAFCLLVDQPPAGWALPAHLHRDHAETIHVVEGAFEVELDGRSSRLLAGETIHVPRGVVHASHNVGATQGRRLLLFTPGGMEDFFLEVGSATPGATIDPGRLRAAAGRHGWEFASG